MDLENCNLATALAHKELPTVNQVEEDAPTAKKTAGSFNPDTDTKPVPLNPSDPSGKTVTIGTALSDK